MTQAAVASIIRQALHSSLHGCSDSLSWALRSKIRVFVISLNEPFGGPFELFGAEQRWQASSAPLHTCATAACAEHHLREYEIRQMRCQLCCCQARGCTA
eukprot:CAMPEP_0170572676 /NCGR_PEP_ID=MMETSP0224-20130122/2344_1 /TAXON_ID=285029 /ORGANISM="Togula jolla, Strain CCCM 725" /LENGTH=99 /DNA_ID=CAMNT_0010895183 /DNA_START=30 /DNA_END=326 /DNA_ORIENTATION=-